MAVAAFAFTHTHKPHQQGQTQGGTGHEQSPQIVAETRLVIAFASEAERCLRAVGAKRGQRRTMT